MKNNTNGIPPELLKVEERLKKNIDATKAFFNENPNLFQQLQDLINTRNELIEEGKSLCKRHKCSTEMFKANTAKTVVYDPASFRDVFGPKKLADACEIKNKVVEAMVVAGTLDPQRLAEVQSEEKETVRVTPKVKPWVVPED